MKYTKWRELGFGAVIMGDILDPETFIFTVPDPAIFGPDVNTIDVPNIICDTLTVNTSLTAGGLKLATDTIAAPPMTLSYMQAVSASPANIPIAIIPKGNGGILVDYPDNTAAGGAARGTFSLDLQFNRTAASQVASGTNSLLAGTTSCTASAAQSAAIASDTSVVASSNSLAAASFGSSITTTGLSAIIATTVGTIAGGVNQAIISGNNAVLQNANFGGFMATDGSTANGGSAIAIIADTGSNMPGSTDSLIAACNGVTVNTMLQGSVISSTGVTIQNSTMCSAVASTSTGPIAFDTASANSAAVATRNCVSTGSLFSGFLGSDTCTLTGNVNLCATVGSNAVTISSPAVRSVTAGVLTGAISGVTQSVFAGGSNSITITAALRSGMLGTNTSQCVNTIDSAVVASTTGIINTNSIRGLIAASNGSTLTTMTGGSAIATTTVTLQNSTMCAALAANSGGPIAFDTNSQYSAVVASQDSAVTTGSWSGLFASTASTLTTPTYSAAVAANTVVLDTCNTVLASGTTFTATNCTQMLGAVWTGTANGCNGSVVLGTNIAATRANAFIFSDGAAGAFDGPNNNTFAVATTGAVSAVFYSNAALTTGVTLAAGASAWAAVSDRRVKENIVAVDPAAYVDMVRAMPLYTYNYIGTPMSQRCIGPMAQDWNPAFVTSKDPLRIDSGDVLGVLLAAVKGLAERVDELTARVDALTVHQ